MKQKMIYISDEMFEALKKENASALVERLCQEYFKKADLKNMTPEQRAERIKVLEIEIEAEKKLREAGIKAEVKTNVSV